MDDGQLAGEFQKNAKERVRVRLTEFGGHRLIDIRAFYPEGEEWKPGKGITLRRELLPELREALREAERLSDEKPAIKDESEVQATEEAAKLAKEALEEVKSAPDNLQADSTDNEE